MAKNMSQGFEEISFQILILLITTFDLQRVSNSSEPSGRAPGNLLRLTWVSSSVHGSNKNNHNIFLGEFLWP